MFLLRVSEAGVKLYCQRLTETLPKLKRHHLVLAILCRQVFTGQSSHLSTVISYSYVNRVIL